MKANTRAFSAEFRPTLVSSKTIVQATVIQALISNENYCWRLSSHAFLCADFYILTRFSIASTCYQTMVVQFPLIGRNVLITNLHHQVRSLNTHAELKV